MRDSLRKEAYIELKEKLKDKAEVACYNYLNRSKSDLSMLIRELVLIEKDMKDTEKELTLLT
jgi:hypothetical protein